MKGKFIVLEGLEGAGKSTAHQAVLAQLKKSGIMDIVMTREPGGTPLAEKLRHLIKHELEEPVCDKAELLMLYAARVQLVENVIRPALAEGKWVLGDRHDMSTQAYQGGGRQIDSHLLDTLKKTILGKFEPDFTIYLDIDPQSLDFFYRTRQRYVALTQNNKKAVIINAEQPLEKVVADIQQAVEKFLSFAK